MTESPEDYELFHYGVKGMKWGVRKKERSSEIAKLKSELKDSSKHRKDSKKAFVKSQHLGFTPPSAEAARNLKEADVDLKTSRRRLSDQKLYESAMRASPSKSRTKLEGKYLERGYSDRDAKIAAERYIRTRRIVVAAAVTTVAVAGTVAARNYNINNVDKILKSGTKLQHISADSSDSVRDAFYSAVTPGDKTRYRGHFGRHVLTNGGKPYVKTVETLSDIRQASPKTARGVLSDVFSDADNRRRFLETLESNPSAPAYMKIAQRHLKDGRVSKEVYDAFNTHLVFHDETHQPLIDKFYSGLKDKGFNAILDSNDMKFSGYNAQRPLITFGAEGVVKVTDVAKLTMKTMEADHNKTLNSDAKKELAKIGAGAATAILAKSATTRVSNNVRDSRTIEKYRAEHPDTKLDNSEILYAVKKSQLKR